MTRARPTHRRLIVTPSSLCRAGIMAIALANFAASADLHAQPLIMPGSTGDPHGFSAVLVDDWKDLDKGNFIEWKLVEVVDINRNLDLLCIMQNVVTDDETAFIRKINDGARSPASAMWYKVEHPVQDYLFVPLDFNDDCTVVGYFDNGSPPPANELGFRATFDPAGPPYWTLTPYFTEMGGQVTGINSDGDMCGWRYTSSRHRGLVWDNEAETWYTLEDPSRDETGVEPWNRYFEVSSSEALAISERFDDGGPTVYIAGTGVDSGWTHAWVGTLWRAYIDTGGNDHGDFFDYDWTPVPTAIATNGVICGYETPADPNYQDQPAVWVPTDTIDWWFGYQIYPFIPDPLGYHSEYRWTHASLDMHQGNDGVGDFATVTMSNGGIRVWDGVLGEYAGFTFFPMHRAMNYSVRAVDGSFAGTCGTTYVVPDIVPQKEIEVFAGTVLQAPTSAIGEDPLLRGGVEPVKIFLPVIVFPHDADNDVVPDYRQIALDPSMHDINGNGIIDFVEDFRSGVYSVGDAYDDPLNRCELIPESQITRMHYDTDDIASIVAGTFGAHFEENINLFGTNPAPSVSPGTEREVIVMTRTREFSGSDTDVIPSDPTAILANLVCFASVTARSIDYFQPGNEPYGNGPGSIYFAPNTLRDLPNGGTFENIRALWGTDQTAARRAIDQATDAYFGYIETMANEVRGASGMMGRPLRIIAPAATMDALYGASAFGSGAWTSDFNATLIFNALSKSNAWADIVDCHFHWSNTGVPGQGVEDLDDVCAWITGQGTDNWLVTEDIVPEQVGSTEWSPKANDPFWKDGAWGEVNLKRYFHLHPESPTDDLPFDTYVQTKWLVSPTPAHRPAAQQVSVQGGIDLALGYMDTHNFLFACYGEALMGGRTYGDNVDVFTIASISGPYLKYSYDPDRINEWVAVYLETASAPKMIQPFDLDHRVLTSGEVHTTCNSGP